MVDGVLDAADLVGFCLAWEEGCCSHSHDDTYTDEDGEEHFGGRLEVAVCRDS